MSHAEPMSIPLQLQTRQLCTIFICLTVITGCNASNDTRSHPMNEYSTRVKFKENQELAFPDFTLRYSGKTQAVPKQYPRGFTYFNFVVKADKHSQNIRWSSGTGDIGPLNFSVDGKPFSLELRVSDKLGTLARDELVISPR